MEISKFNEKLNKVDGKVYVIEEEIQMPESGVYEAQLQHDNIYDATLSVYTGPKLTGEQINSYSVTTPALTPWKRVIRINTDARTVYICYETEGDTVEADDVNDLQDALAATQEAVNDVSEEVDKVKESVITSDEIDELDGIPPESGGEPGGGIGEAISKDEIDSILSM